MIPGRVKPITFGSVLSVFVFCLLTECLSKGVQPPHLRVNSAEGHSTADGIPFRVEVIAEHLVVPWSMAFLPDGRMLITERPGRLRVLEDGSLRPEPVARLPEVTEIGEGGLMGLALHPDFPANHRIYLSYTACAEGRLINRVVQYKFERDKVSEPFGILEDLPGALIHDGCRIKFGPDRKLYVTTGYAAQPDFAQQMDSLAGKILRVNDDGSVPFDNPFPNSPIYSLGHRNPQGIDWHPETDSLYETEHGPSLYDGPLGGDEVNLIEPGKNYGWPAIHHIQAREGMLSPLLEYTPAVAPAGATFYRGALFPAFRNNLFFANLQGARLIRVVWDQNDPRKVRSTEPLLAGIYGRLRDVVQGPDGYLYFCTSNRDGRGRPVATDDRVLRMVPAG